MWGKLNFPSQFCPPRAWTLQLRSLLPETHPLRATVISLNIKSGKRLLGCDSGKAPPELAGPIQIHFCLVIKAPESPRSLLPSPPDTREPPLLVPCLPGPCADQRPLIPLPSRVGTAGLSGHTPGCLHFLRLPPHPWQVSSGVCLSPPLGAPSRRGGFLLTAESPESALTRPLTHSFHAPDAYHVPGTVPERPCWTETEREPRVLRDFLVTMVLKS